jgi:hypothetical protein
MHRLSQIRARILVYSDIHPQKKSNGFIHVYLGFLHGFTISKTSAVWHGAFCPVPACVGAWVYNNMKDARYSITSQGYIMPYFVEIFGSSSGCVEEK